MKESLRKRVASKAKRMLTAQDAGPVPKVTDPGPEGAPPKDEGAPGGKPAPGAPPSPPKPPMGGPEKDLDKELRHDKEEEAAIEKLTDKVDKLVDKLDVLVDSQEDVAKILKKKFLDEDDMDEDLKEFKEDEEEDDEEEFSVEEFGVDTDSLVLGREDEEKRMSATKLRKARKERLYKNVKEAKEDKEAAIDKDVDTLSEEFDLEKAKNKKFKPSAPAPTITKVKKSEVPDMLKLAELDFELNASKDKWTVIKVADGVDTPLYEIEKPEEAGDEFATEDFARELISDMQDQGVEAVLEQHNAKKVEAQLEEPQVQEPVAVEQTVEVEAEGTQETLEAVEETPQETVGDIRRRFSRAFRVAQKKIAKNLTASNPLKAAFFDILVEGLNLPEDQASRAIEAAFSKGADDHLEVALAETDKLLDMSDEAFVEVESTIVDSEVLMPQVDAESAGLSEQAKSMRKRAASGSIPLTTATSSDPSDRMERIREALPTPKNWKLVNK